MRQNKGEMMMYVFIIIIFNLWNTYCQYKGLTRSGECLYLRKVRELYTCITVEIFGTCSPFAKFVPTLKIVHKGDLYLPPTKQNFKLKRTKFLSNLILVNVKLTMHYNCHSSSSLLTV